MGELNRSWRPPDKAEDLNHIEELLPTSTGLYPIRANGPSEK